MAHPDFFQGGRLPTLPTPCRRPWYGKPNRLFIPWPLTLLLVAPRASSVLLLWLLFDTGDLSGGVLRDGVWRSAVVGRMSQ